MKKLVSIAVLIFMLSAICTIAFAADANKLPEMLTKAYEKMSKDVSYVMEAKSKAAGQEFSSKMKAYFKDNKNYRMDSEVAGQKTRTVVCGDTAWNYMEAANMIMTMPVPQSPAEMKKDVTYIEGKDGDNLTFTSTDAASKFKIIITVNAKDSLISKMVTMNEKDEVISEVTYSEWKFEKIDEAMFKKPEGAQEMKMPEPPKTK